MSAQSNPSKTTGWTLRVSGAEVLFSSSLPEQVSAEELRADAAERLTHELRRLESGNDLLRGMLDAASDEIWFYDHGLNVRYVNLAGTLSTGAGHGAEMPRRVPPWLVRPETAADADLLQPASPPSIAPPPGGDDSRTVELPGEAGAPSRWKRIDSRPVVGPGGERVGTLAIVQDITDAVRQEGEASQRSAKTAAEEAVRTRTQFLSTISHELRTPISAIIGLADLLLTEVIGSLTPRQKDYLTRIQASGRHMISIVDDILMLARSEAGKEMVRLAAVDLTEIVYDVVAMLSDPAATKGLTLEVEGVDSPLRFVTDAGKIRQILINLVGNAIRYTDAGGVRVEVRRRAGHVELAVRDTGPGIPADRSEDIFEPFVQVHASRALGSGLGLSICRRLARLLGGDVFVESAAGHGSAFTVSLPNQPEDAVDPLIV